MSRKKIKPKLDSGDGFTFNVLADAFSDMFKADRGEKTDDQMREAIIKKRKDTESILDRMAFLTAEKETEDGM